MSPRSYGALVRAVSTAPGDTAQLVAVVALAHAAQAEGDLNADSHGVGVAGRRQVCLWLTENGIRGLDLTK